MKKYNIKSKGSQKHFRKVPEIVKSKLNTFSSDIFSVSAVKKISQRDITAGKYSSLGLQIGSEREILYPSSQIPHPKLGRYARINSQGIELRRTDLPKVSKTFYIDAPNFGDWSRGSHTVSWDREVYPRDYIAPKQLEIEIELLATEEVDGEKLYVFRFTVVEALDRKDVDKPRDVLVKDNLFFNLNLLQESVGAADVFPSTATKEDYLDSLYVSWEILPIGERDSVVTRILSGVKAPTEALRKRIAERYDLLMSYKPGAFISGSSGLRRYFGAKFADDLVVFEHLEYGNALYVMFEKWESLSQLSRPQLLGGDRKGFERIIHRTGWETKLANVLLSKGVSASKASA